MKENGTVGRAYYSPKEAAEIFGVKTVTIYTWIRDGHLKAHKAGPLPKSPLRIPVAEVERLLTELGS
jgi:excisionase family DNA binding protein